MKEHRYGRMVASMRGCGTVTRQMAKEDSFMQMETFTRVTGSTIRLKGMEFINI